MTLMERRRALMAVKKGGKSDMHGWTDDVSYTDIEFVQNEYVTKSGAFASYNGWNRTGYVPCNGASSIVFPATSFNGSKEYQAFFDTEKNFVRSFSISRQTSVTVEVPENAAYFACSLAAGYVEQLFENGVTPYK